MIDQRVFDIFCRGLQPLIKKAISPDWGLWSTLTDARKGVVRRGFNIPYTEELIYVRDTSFWNSGNQGIVFTDRAIYVIWDNDKPQDAFSVSWSMVKQVEYREDALYLYFTDDTDSGPVSLNTFVKEPDDNLRASFGVVISNIINEVAQHLAAISMDEEEQRNQIWQKYWNEYWGLVNNGCYQEATDYSYQELSIHHLAGMLTYGLVVDPDPFHAIQLLESEYASWEFHDYTRNVLLFLRSYLYEKSGNILLARSSALFAWQQIPEDLIFEGYNWNLKESSLTALNRLHERYVETFYDQPYQHRKLVMVVDSYTQLDQKQIAVLDPTHLQNMTFPIGHPITNQLYVAHPLVQTHYIPFENYEIELIKDRVHEFCSLMECIGATSISIDYQQALDSENEYNRDIRATAEASFKHFSAEGTQHQNETRKFMQSIGSQLNLEQTYNPTQYPYLPDNLLWYPQEPTWQRLVGQRMRGSLVSHTECIETRTTQVINNDTLFDIEAELKVLLANANLQISNTTSEKFKQHENVVLRIHVEFAPISALNKEQAHPLPEVQSSIQSPSQLSTEESEYVEMFQEALSETGMIDVSVRKMLSRFATKLGISPERASALEQLSSQILTPEEMEYVNAVKDIINEEGALSSVSLRILKRFASKLGIASERADALNNFIVPS